jgi:hypothetical protein
MRSARFALAGLFFVSISAPVPAAIITQYTAPGSSFAPTTVAPFTTAGPLNDTGSWADLQPGDTLPNSVFLQQNVASPTPAAGVANNQFFQFSTSASTGFSLNLSNLTFDAGRGGPSTPRGWVLRSSVDSFSSTIATADVNTQQPTMSPFAVNLAAPVFQNLSDVTFRLYGYAPGTGVGMFYDNLTLNGSVTAPSLVRYEAPGSSFSPTSVGAHVSASALNDTGSWADLQPGDTLPNSVFLQQNVASPTPAAGVANNQFFQFTLAPDAGFQMDVFGLHFDAGRGGPSTPRGWVLRSSLDGFLSDLATSDVNTQQPTLSSFDIDLPDAAFQDLASALTFRLYGYAPESGVGMFYDNLFVFGAAEAIPVVVVPTPPAVPEPGSLLLAAIGLIAALRFARYRRACDDLPEPA